jgi:glycosyltransferase involved in cell wall biosynthesis
MEVLGTYPDTLIIVNATVGANLVPQYQAIMASRWRRYENNIRWEFGTAHGKMPLYYSAADLFISISSNDSLPNVMLEAMACEVPVIMGDIPQIRGWVENNRNGYLVPPRDRPALVGVIKKNCELARQLVVDKLTRSAFLF